MTVTRTDLLRALVLNEASDSYQPFEKIDRNSQSLPTRFGLVVSSAAVVAALADLIGSGPVKAVWLSSREPPLVIEGMPAEADIPRVYFFQTEEGLKANANGFWPFDDSGNPQRDFSIVPGTE